MEFRDTFFGRHFKANPSCKLKPKSSSSAVLFNFICAVLKSPFSLKTILASLAIVLQQTIMYVCMCVCMYACMYVCLSVCLSVRACVCVKIRTWTTWQENCIALRSNSESCMFWQTDLHGAVGLGPLSCQEVVNWTILRLIHFLNNQCRNVP